MLNLTPILTDAATLRDRVRSKVVAELQKVSPVDLRGRTLELKDVRVHEQDYSPEDQKRALLTGDSLTEPVKGTLVLRNTDGSVVDEVKHFTLTHLPYFTERHTIVMDGNEYQVANMLRRRPGVYTQRSANGELKTSFNLSKGANFHVSMDPEKGAFYIVHDSTQIPLYATLRALGTSHEDIATSWGSKVADVNKRLFDSKQELAIGKLYQKLVHPSKIDPKAAHDVKLSAVVDKLNATTMDARVTKATLGLEHGKVTPETLVASGRKLLRVHNGEENIDDSDSLAYKTFHSVDDFLSERVRLTAREWTPRARNALNGKDDIRAALKPAPFSASMKKFITTSALTAVPTGINPIELIDHAVKVTALGEGGIPSERAIPFETRLTHASHFGILDPIRTPESGHAGVDIRATIAAHRDEEGNLYTPLKNVRTGEVDFVKAGDLHNLVVAFPGQHLNGQVDVLHKGSVKKADAKTVNYEQLHVSHTYSPATSLIPLLHSIQGNRAIMGSKMQTQGLPLLKREAPLVQVLHPDGGSFEGFYGHMVCPVAPVSGTIRKIENGYVYIEPKKAKRASEKVADRPIKTDKKLGGLTFKIEIKKGEAPWGDKFPEDYGYLPGYEGPDGDSLDFWVGDDEGGTLWAVDTEEDGVPTDVKYIVGVDKPEPVMRQIEKKPGCKCKNLREYDSWDALKGSIEEYKRSKTAASPSAVLITGNPKYIKDNPAADKFYEAIEQDLKAKGYTVRRDPGEPYTSPPNANLWIGHSRGADRLRFAPSGTRTLAFGSNAKGAINHPDDVVEMSAGHVPPAAHYVFTPEMADAIHSVKTASDRGLVKVPYQTNFPFPSKTRLHHDLSVKVGDTVEEGARLGDSNYTRNGILATGLNARVAYMPYYGLNSNDAVVISEGFSERMTSEHMYREVFQLAQGIELSKDRHRVYFGSRYTPGQYSHLDADGVVKKGAKVAPHDILVAGLIKSQITGTDAMLGRISKALTKPFREVTLAWEHGTQGEVVDVVRTGDQIAILVKTHEKMQVGDKLAGRYGNKGVVASIVPDAKMLKDEGGKPVELIMTSAGVVSRINPAQLHEALLGKIAEKTGKPILFDNADSKNVVEWVEALAKKHSVKEKEHLFDPISGRKITGQDGEGVNVGRSFIFKLFKSTDTNFSGHGVGPYDINEQPVKQGGSEGAKGLGKMEFDALIAHNARGVISDAANVRGQKNDEFWRAVQLGMPLPTYRPSFAYNKFQAMLQGAGVKVDRRGSRVHLLPMTDKDILAKSAGAIENRETLIAKNLKPEPGGLFDPMLTGGPQGTLYSHINLHEAVPNPVFEEPVRRLLGLTEKQFTEMLHEKGGAHIKEELARINVDAKIKAERLKLRTLKGAELNDCVKKVKYLEALKKEGIKPQDAYILSKVPVIPPVFRPVTPQPNNPSQVSVGDSNRLYGHLIDVNNVVKSTVLESDVPKHRAALYNAVGAVFGTHEVDDQELQGQSVKGFLTMIGGHGSPKGGFFQRKLMKRQQDVSGRGTAVPDGNLHMDAVGLPEDQLWQMFDKFLVARLIKKGYGALHARELVDRRQPAAKQALNEEIKERPVLINRAPTLHRYGIVAAYAQPVKGKTIRVSPFVEKGMNLDYDGDTLQVHAPVTPQGIEDAKQMTMSHLLLSDQSRNKLMAYPQHEAIIGITHALRYGANPNSKVRKFKSNAEAISAWRKGEIKVDDPYEVEGEKTAECVDPLIFFETPDDA